MEIHSKWIRVIGAENDDLLIVNNNAIKSRKVSEAVNNDINTIIQSNMASDLNDGFLSKNDKSKINLLRPGNRNIIVFKSNTYWTVPTDISTIWVTVVGGGGGGGGTAKNRGCGGGGGGAASVLHHMLNVTPGAQIQITIGTGGTGGQNDTNPTAGGLSSFGTYITCNGGGRGYNGSGGAAASGGVAGTSNISDYIHGSDGSVGFYRSGYTVAGFGGSSILGTGGSPGMYNMAGYDAMGFGAGGGGAASADTTDRKGGNGSNGIIIVHM